MISWSQLNMKITPVLSFRSLFLSVIPAESISRLAGLDPGFLRDSGIIPVLESSNGFSGPKLTA
jgi:hypothetical protein